MKIFFASLLCITLVFLCSCTAERRPEGNIIFFAFSHSGSSTGSIYTYRAEQTADGWQTEISLLCGAQTYEFVMTAEEAERLCALINSYKLWKWNGFDKIDSRVLDGSSFHLTLRYADTAELTAHGSNVFPDGYGSALSEINLFFDELISAHQINHDEI